MAYATVRFDITGAGTHDLNFWVESTHGDRSAAAANPHRRRRPIPRHRRHCACRKRLPRTYSPCTRGPHLSKSADPTVRWTIKRVPDRASHRRGGLVRRALVCKRSPASFEGHRSRHLRPPTRIEEFIARRPQDSDFDCALERLCMLARRGATPLRGFRSHDLRCRSRVGTGCRG